MLVAAGTPTDIVAKLNSAVVNALKAPDVRKLFAERGYTSIGDTPEHFAATIRARSKNIRV